MAPMISRRGLLAGLLTLPLAAKARPPDPGTEDYEIMKEFKDWVVTQHANNGMWCCDLGDGRPLHDDEIRYVPGSAIPGGTGPSHYQIFYTKKHWDDGTDEWIDVPESALMRIPNPLGMPVAWVIHGHVFCLSLSGAV